MYSKQTKVIIQNTKFKDFDTERYYYCFLQAIS